MLAPARCRCPANRQQPCPRTGPSSVHVTPAKPTAAASTPESRSAAALALSHEPTYDEGTAQRIREAALSYSDIAVRGGWPTIPADAKFVSGAQGPHDNLLRLRLLISGDLAPDKASGPYNDVVAESLEAFPGASRPRGDGNHDPAHPRRAQRAVAEADQAARGLARAPQQYEFRVWTTLRRRQYPRGIRRSGRKRYGGAALSGDRRQDRKTVADADR